MNNKYFRLKAVHKVMMLMIFITVVIVPLRIGQSVSYSGKHPIAIKHPIVIKQGELTALIPIDKQKFDILQTSGMGNLTYANSSHLNGELIGFIIPFILLLVGVLIYMRVGLFKKEETLHHLKSLHKELERLKESYTLALDSANGALWEWNLQTNEIITSDKWIDVTGNALNGHGLSGILQKENIQPEDYPGVLAAFDACLKGEAWEFQREYRIRNKDGNYTWVLNRGRVYVNDQGIPSRLAGAVSNIEEQKQRESKIEYMAFYDILTGLPNRMKFMSILEETLESIEKKPCRYSILMIDLDNFKIHNALLGLDFCDQLLKQVGSRLSQICGKNNVVARYGGDEFLILVKNLEDIQEMASLCQNILAVFLDPFVLREKSVYLSVSIGVVRCLFPGQTASDVLQNADAALNKAKESGKNKYCVYDEKIHDEISRKSKVEACIRKALAEDTFFIYYQPQQDIVRNRIRGVEALARLYSEELGMISPLEFIAAAESTGLIIPLGSWILKNACIQGKAWIDRGCKFGKLSVNISVHQMHSGNFYDTVKEILKETQFPVNQLELEITESILLEFSRDNIEILKNLRSLGISIALDDFGTGYSSLNYLTVLPIDILKIDKSFLGRTLDSGTRHQVIRSIIELAHVLNLNVVSEGVETAEQKQILKEMGCDYIQGYYFSKPVDAAGVEKWFRKEL